MDFIIMTCHQYNQLQSFIQRFEEDPPLHMPHYDNFIPTQCSYNNVLNDFIKFMYDQHLIASNYLDILTAFGKTYRPRKFIAELNEAECLLLLSGFIKQDRFTRGLLITQMITGNVAAVLQRLKQFAI